MNLMVIVLGMFLAACGSAFSDKERIENWVYDRATQDNLQYISVDPTVSFQGVIFQSQDVLEYTRSQMETMFGNPHEQISLVSIETRVQGRRLVQVDNLQNCGVRIVRISGINNLPNLYNVEGTFILPLEIQLGRCLQYIQNQGEYTIHFRTSSGSEFRVTKKLILREQTAR